MFLRFLPRHPLLRLALLLLWLACVAVLSLMAKPPRPPSFLSSDKLQHLCAYALLTLFAAGVLVPRMQSRVSGWLLSAAGATVTGVALELLQMRLHNHRHGDPYDILANLVGILLVTIVGICIGACSEPPRSSG